MLSLPSVAARAAITESHSPNLNQNLLQAEQLLVVIKRVKPLTDFDYRYRQHSMHATLPLSQQEFNQALGIINASLLAAEAKMPNEYKLMTVKGMVHQLHPAVLSVMMISTYGIGNVRDMNTCLLYQCMQDKLTQSVRLVHLMNSRGEALHHCVVMSSQPLTATLSSFSDFPEDAVIIDPCLGKAFPVSAYCDQANYDFLVKDYPLFSLVFDVLEITELGRSSLFESIKNFVMLSGRDLHAVLKQHDYLYLYYQNFIRRVESDTDKVMIAARIFLEVGHGFDDIRASLQKRPDYQKQLVQAVSALLDVRAPHASPKEAEVISQIRDALATVQPYNAVNILVSAIRQELTGGARPAKRQIQILIDAITPHLTAYQQAHERHKLRPTPSTIPQSLTLNIKDYVLVTTFSPRQSVIHPTHAERLSARELMKAVGVHFLKQMHYDNALEPQCRVVDIPPKILALPDECLQRVGILLLSMLERQFKRKLFLAEIMNELVYPVQPLPIRLSDEDLLAINDATLKLSDAHHQLLRETVQITVDDDEAPHSQARPMQQPMPRETGGAAHVGNRRPSPAAVDGRRIHLSAAHGTYPPIGLLSAQAELLARHRPVDVSDRAGIVDYTRSQLDYFLNAFNFTHEYSFRHRSILVAAIILANAIENSAMQARLIARLQDIQLNCLNDSTNTYTSLKELCRIFLGSLQDDAVSSAMQNRNILEVLNSICCQSGKRGVNYSHFAETLSPDLIGKIQFNLYVVRLLQFVRCCLSMCNKKVLHESLSGQLTDEESQHIKCLVKRLLEGEDDLDAACLDMANREDGMHFRYQMIVHQSQVAKWRDKFEALGQTVSEAETKQPSFKLLAIASVNLMNVAIQLELAPAPRTVRAPMATQS